MGRTVVIPKLIHFVWTGLPGQPAPPMPGWAQANIEAFRGLNLEYDVQVHGEEALLPKYRELYGAASSFAHTSDLLRYSLLQRYGGWYFDVDVFPLRPVRDIESAYALDGKRLFITEQHGQKNKALTHNGAILAAGAECVTWPAIDERLMRLRSPLGRIDTGPGLLTALYKEHSRLFEVGAWPWFYPAKIGQATRLYDLVRERGPHKARHIAPTGGQLPFVVHLWANEKQELPRHRSSEGMATYVRNAKARGRMKGLQVCLTPNAFQWNKSKVCAEPFHAIAEGLAKIGCDVDVHDCEKVTDLQFYDLVVIWNGRRGHHKRVADLARKHCIPALYLELGFFSRNTYWQADTKGILHWASWVNDLMKSVPSEGEKRFRAVWPRRLRGFHGRKGRGVLVLGQVAGDSQMDESEIKLSTPLEKIVARSLPDGVEAVFRPHPKAQVKRVAYLPRSDAETLEQAVEQAQFAVTINSNAGNECLAMGCPVLCFGPALYAKAGVAKQTTVAGFRQALQEMLDGWHPEAEEVRNYLHWLACRQWNQDEFREGTVLRELIRRAMS